MMICRELMPAALRLTDCPAGTYQDASAQTTCMSCPPGFYCPEQSASKIPCPPGTYVNGSGHSSLEDCVPCLLGFSNWRVSQPFLRTHTGHTISSKMGTNLIANS